MHEKEYQDHIQDHTCSYRPSGDQNSHKSKPSIGFQYRMLLTLANQIFLRLDLPELNLFPVIKLGPNNILRVVWTVSEGVQVSKLLHEESKSHENQASDISYMSPLKKMLAILLYQLFVPNKKAFLQFMSRGPLNATFWHSLFRSFFHTWHPFPSTANIFQL